MNIQERIEILKAEISERELELKTLSDKLMSEETDTHKKFQAWVNNGLDKEISPFIPDGDLRKWVDEHLDLGSLRGSVDLLGYDDSFGIFSESDETVKEWNCEDRIEELKNDSIFIKACEQMMKENVEGFEIDW